MIIHLYTDGGARPIPKEEGGELRGPSSSNETGSSSPRARGTSSKRIPRTNELSSGLLSRPSLT
jgi:hypothetical protein